MIEFHVLPLFAAWLATMLALWVEHAILRQPPWPLQPPGTYVVGVLTIIGGYALWIGLEIAAGVRQISIELALVALVVIGPGAGLIVLGLYYWDARTGRREQQQHIDGMARDAKGLTKELTRGTHEPRRDN